MIDDKKSKEEQMPDDLELAAIEYFKEALQTGNDSKMQAFKAGTKWMKQQLLLHNKEYQTVSVATLERLYANERKMEQLLNEAVDAAVNSYEEIGGECYVEFIANISPSKYKEKMTVKLIIIEED